MTENKQIPETPFALALRRLVRRLRRAGEGWRVADVPVLEHAADELDLLARQASARAAEGLEQLEAKLRDLQRGTPMPGEPEATREDAELLGIHCTLNVVLGEIAALRRVTEGR